MPGFLRTQLNLFFVALVFFTRLPAPAWVDHSGPMLQRSRAYFPVMGWIVGGLTGLAAWGAGFAWPAGIAVGLSMALGLLLTGAFHEDGFGDVCDGFGGGYSPEQILTIMKDSRMGAYGVLGMALMLLLKFLCLQALLPYTKLDFIWLLVAAHALSRLAASAVAQWLPYAQDLDKSKIKPIATQPLKPLALLGSAVVGLLPLAFLPWPACVAAVACLLAAWPMARWFRRQIGGYTGDCLGAVQQVSELCFYLCVVALWN